MFEWSFEVGVDKATDRQTTYGNDVLQVVIHQLKAVRLGAIQLNDEVLLYTIDMALSRANELSAIIRQPKVVPFPRELQ